MKVEKEKNEGPNPFSKVEEGDQSDRGHRGEQFTIAAKDRQSRFAKERGPAMFTVPEAEARKNQIESAIDFGIPGPNNELGLDLASAYVSANIDYCQAVLETNKDERAQLSARDRMSEFVEFITDAKKLRQHLTLIANKYRKDVSSLRSRELIDEDVEFRIQQTDRKASNWSALANLVPDQWESQE